MFTVEQSPALRSACVSRSFNLYGGGAMSREALHALLRDLPPDLQRAVHQAVARCCPHYRPRPYAHDWHEELYHEAACAACEAWQRYDSAKGSLYAWGMRIISQRLHRFCKGVWAACRQEVDWPRDEETGEEQEFEDKVALAAVEEAVLCGQVRLALAQLREDDRQLLEWYFGAGLSEREIAGRLGCSHVRVHQRLHSSLVRLCQMLGVEHNLSRRRRDD